MEGEKETAKEEEEEEEEEEEDLHHIAAISIDHQELPIMHWEDLSQRIAELEQQERSERSKRPEEGEWRDVWEEDEEDLRKCRVAVVSSRFQHHKNLQLCFVNNSDSEEDEEKEVSKGAGQNGCRGAGLKQEVVSALRRLRDELLANQREGGCVSSNCVSERKHLELQELQQRSVTQLRRERDKLQQEVHALSSQLVSLLLVRDQLRTKQDAMLLDVQDLT
ncbi:hypothetical protein OYC64_020958 [Pagothenia borchgrevinki]|uniref:Schwannomin interacting protein 1 C-terminal domain-containing protein n=1 Tax=Pagothenia borchgrevinki TaxID=8213 RepID=A0ABD2FN08_PAGBO